MRQSNLAITYQALGRSEESMRLRRDVYSGRLKLNGKEHQRTFIAALNYAYSLGQLRHFEEAKSLLRKTIRVARRVLGENHELTFRMRWCYGKALYSDANAPLDDLREAVLKHEELERIARRVLGGAHPMVAGIEKDLRNARILLAAHETPSTRTSA